MQTDRQILAQHYETPKALALLEKAGWPEWVDTATNQECRLIWYQGSFCEEIGDDLSSQTQIGRMVVDDGDYTALRTLRDHVRVTLEKRWFNVEISHPRGQLCQITLFGGDDRDGEHYIMEPTYDAALLAGLAAAQTEGE